jgi:2-dehydro-3-deoxyphosphooctonate aldolase (KDO 8-P synthase)
MAKNPFPKAPVKAVKAGRVRFGGGAPLALIAGPCVIESRAMAFDLAARLVALAKKEKIPLVFKASYDKANRTSLRAFRGPGLVPGLEILAGIKEQVRRADPGGRAPGERSEARGGSGRHLAVAGVPVPPDGLVVALGESGRVVNIKKGQFLAPWDVRHVIEKVESTGNRNILLTERGASFGYNNLVADFRSLLIMRQFGYPVVFDATHSVQLPGGRGDGTGGDGKWAPYLSRAAVAAGCDGLFWETHRNPPEAKSDKDNALPLEAIGPLWRQCRGIDELA